MYSKNLCCICYPLMKTNRNGQSEKKRIPINVQRKNIRNVRNMSQKRAALTTLQKRAVRWWWWGGGGGWGVDATTRTPLEHCPRDSTARNIQSDCLPSDWRLFGRVWSYPHLLTLWERTCDKIRFNDVITCQKCDTLHDCACSIFAAKKPAFPHELPKMDFQDQFVAINVKNISPVVFRKENQ